VQSRRLIRGLLSWRGVFVLAAAVAVAVGAPHAWAWYHLRAARSALTTYHPDVARDHLANCLKIWPTSAEVHLLASRAAWQSGDVETADQHLRAAQQSLGASSNEVALEWAMLHASSGNLREVDEFLQRRAAQDAAIAPVIWEAVADGYLRVYRNLDAMACLDHWLTVQPDNLRALELRGTTLQSAKQTHKAADDFRRVIQMDSTRSPTRWRLALCLLDSGAYQEAMPHLQALATEKPNDPDIQVRLARCHKMLGRDEQAEQILDEVLAVHPDHALALRTRGQFLISDGKPAQAEPMLKRAAAVAPDDYLSQFLFYESLQKQNKTAEAEAQLQVANAAKERAERLGDLQSRRMYEQPLNPALHYELGVILLRGGHKNVGESWLLSALSLDPNYRPAHAALADYYAQEGDTKRADEHRRKSEK